MKWKHTPNIIDRYMRWFDGRGDTQPGEQKIIKRFLFLPTKVEAEVRWLETAYIIQVHCRGGYGGIVGGDWWESIRWYDDNITPEIIEMNIEDEYRRQYILITVLGFVLLFLCPIAMVLLR